jgi:hypothetical protein
MKNTKPTRAESGFRGRRLARRYIDQILESGNDWFLVNAEELKTMLSVIRSELKRGLPRYEKLVNAKIQDAIKYQ